MPDQLFEAFHVDAEPPPVEAVRRRGDRRRRRRRLAAGGGAAGAAALLAIGAVVAGGSFRHHAVGPANQQPRPWVTTLGSDLPLASGTNAASAPITVAAPLAIPDGSPIVDTITECGRPWQWVLGATAVAGVSAPGAGVGSPGETRTLAVFPDARTAHVVTQSIESTVRACTVAPAPVALHATMGDESFAWLDPGADINGIDLVVRVGNAVLLEQTAEPQSSPPASFPSQRIAAQAAVTWAEPRLSPLIRSGLCVYAAHGCSGKLPVPTFAGATPSPSGSPTRRVVVPPTRVTPHHLPSATGSSTSTDSPTASPSGSPSGSPSASAGSTLPPPPTTIPSATATREAGTGTPQPSPSATQ